MRLNAKWCFAGIQSGPGFSDPSKINYQALFVDGVDSYRFWLNKEQYDVLLTVQPYTVVDVELNFNPAANKVAYALNFVGIR